jgi:Caspase domain
MRKALIVGIDYYSGLKHLSGCVDDAHAIKTVLERHADGTINFGTPKLLKATGPADLLKKGDLKDAIRELYADDAEIALFYFAGHGYAEDTGGYLCGSDSERGDDGVALSEIMTLASKSSAQNKIIVLDSCYSGAAGNRPTDGKVAEITEGMTILTASTAHQTAKEIRGEGGVFTSLFVDALGGAAANLLGEITPGSVYAHIDKSLGTWGQRPVFKTNIKRFVSLRKATPPIALSDLQGLTKYFPTPGYKLKLDPSYEPERTPSDAGLPPPDPIKNAIFAVLQKYAKVNLVRPVDAPHMWHAAIQSKACELTVLGEHYRGLVAKGLV